MGKIDWRCCECHYTFRSHDGLCPKCLHIINPMHNHFVEITNTKQNN